MKLVPSSVVAVVLAGVPAVAVASDAQVPATSASAPAPAPKTLSRFGVLADAGLPDGMNAALVVRPWKWVRVQGGIGSNTMSTGFRGGVTVLPFGWGPSLSLEAGRYGAGNANDVAKRFAGESFENQPFLERVAYDYVNGHVGIDFGSRNFVFFVHGGVTSVRATLSSADGKSQVLSKGDDSGEGGAEVAVGGETKLRAVGPSLKVGLILFVL